MSLAKTKEQLIQLLGHDDNCVIALSGRWGTGKTYLWNKVKTESGDDKVKNALYVSLFGLSSIDQVKRKLIETAIPGVESHEGLFEGLKNLFNAGVKVATEHYKALAAINDLNLLFMAPVLLQSKLIVIDDIERKHEKLGIDEVLGFIDEYSKQHRTRFVLVLNDDQLATKDDQKKLWAKLREKVIDQEIRLLTSAAEAFSIAIALRPSKYAEVIKRASIACSLTNIRVVVKVIKVANQILADQDLQEAIQARVVPSIVLFSAIHYRGMDDAPDFKFALNVGNSDWAGFAKGKDEEFTPEQKREEGWRMLMRELGIYACDEFEEQLVEFLESGLFEAASIEAVINRYVAESEVMKAKEAAQNFLKKVFWDHWVSEAQLVVEADALLPSAGFLHPFVATELQSVLATLPGGAVIGDAIIDAWIEAYRKIDPSTVSDDNPIGNSLHPKIQTELGKIKATAQARASVVEACMYICENSGWGTLQEVALSRATVADFEAAIRDMQDLDKLRRFMGQMKKMRLQREMYDSHFGTATEHFVAACRVIANDAASPRLASLVKRLFDGTPIASELAAESHAAGQAMAPKQNVA